jgi:outer membrane protein assembly factor BamB
VPEAYKEVVRFKAVAGKCWSTPALSNGRLFVRSTKEGACFDLAAVK